MLERVRDKETGEFVIKETFFPVDSFYMTFPEFFKETYGKLKRSDHEIMIHFVSIMEYESNNISLSKEKREYLMNKYGINTYTFSAALKRLRDLHILLGQDGDYMINPAMFWKGNMIKRKEFIEMFERRVSKTLKENTTSE